MLRFPRAALTLVCALALLPGPFCLAAPVAASQAQPATVLDWSQALALWQAQSRALRLARLQVDAAEGDRLAADVAPNPQLSLNLGQMAPGYVGGGGFRDKHIDKVLRVDQLIERGGKRELRTQVADAQLNASRLDLQDTERTQRVALAQAYYGLLQAQERRHLLEETAQLYDTALQAMNLRLKAGDVAPVEVARLRVEAARAVNDARQAQTDHVAARQALALLLNLGAMAANTLEVTPSWPAVDDKAGHPGTVSAELREAVGKRADVQAARSRLQAAEHALDLARSLRTRDVTVGMQVEQCLASSCGIPARSYGVGVSVPLFIGNTYDGEIRRAEAELDMARALTEQAEAQALADLEQAQSALLNSQARRQLMENRDTGEGPAGILADARRAATGAELAYTKGAASLLEVLDARRTLRAVQLEAVQVRYEYAVAAIAWQAALGN